jgi:hypothetical protein
VRRDLTPGAMLAQSCHAMAQFMCENTELAKYWACNSNYICVLEIDDEAALHGLVSRAKEQDIVVSCFVEPDFGNSLTAIALEPRLQSKKLCSNLKLALRDK